MPTRNEWNLISGIFSALDLFESFYGWDLSIGERARFAESFFRDLKDRHPESREALALVFEYAYRNTYGADHECEAPTNAEMTELVLSAYGDYDLPPFKDLHAYAASLGILGDGPKANRRKTDA